MRRRMSSVTRQPGGRGHPALRRQTAHPSQQCRLQHPQAHS